MFILPRRHALKPVRILNYLRSTSLVSEPTWSLYHSCLSRALSRQYHTENVLGQHEKPHDPSRDAVDLSRPPTDVLKAQYHQSPYDTPESSDPRSTELPKIALSYTKIVLRKCVQQLKARAAYVSGSRQDVLERRAHYIRVVYPQALLSVLKSIPCEGTSPKTNFARVELNREIRLKVLPNYVQENTWLHHDGSGCLIKFYQYYAELHGSERAQEIARTYLKSGRHFVQSSENIQWYRQNSNRPWHCSWDISTPPTWTMRSFLEYIVLITRRVQMRSAMRRFHRDSESHHHAVFKKLESAFTHPDSRPFASTEAFRRALSYCRQHTEFSATPIKLWEAFKETGSQPNIACFNQELGRCLVNKELTRFCRLVLDMRDLGTFPNSTTWGIVTAYTSRRSLRAQIFALAEISDVLTNGQHQSFVLAIAEQEFKTYIGTVDGVRNFMQMMEEKFGPKWLTSRILEKLLRICRTRTSNVNLTSEVLNVVNSMGHSGLLDEGCIVELIRISAKAGEMSDVLGLVKLDKLYDRAGIPQAALHTLFVLAWEKKCFNMCRAVWFIAAVSGRITFDMHELVSRSIRTNCGDAEDPTETAWQLLAGKFVVGTNLNTLEFAQLFPELSRTELHSTPTEWLLNWTPNEEVRHEQIQLGQLLVERDLNAYRFFKPFQQGHIRELLDKAKALDEKWEHSNASTDLSPLELIAKAIQPPLVPRDEILRKPDDHEDESPQQHWFHVNRHKLDYCTLQLKDEEAESSADQDNDFTPMGKGTRETKRNSPVKPAMAPDDTGADDERVVVRRTVGRTTVMPKAITTVSDVQAVTIRPKYHCSIRPQYS